MSTDDHRTDWNEARPAHIPEPTYWPMFLAAGIVLRTSLSKETEEQLRQALTAGQASPTKEQTAGAS